MIRHGIILRTGSHGLPALVWENVYRQRWQQDRVKNAGPITRVLTMHATDTDPIWFAADCAAKGHGWYVAPGVLAKHGVSFDAMKREGA